MPGDSFCHPPSVILDRMNDILHDPSRRDFLGVLAKIPLIPASALVARHATSTPEPEERQVLMNDFSIAGFRYYDGNEALPELQAGTPLTLRAQPDNPHDPFAVEILHGRTKLGYVPRFCNRHLSRLLQSDVSLTCEVANVRTDAPPWDAVAVRVSLNQPELQAA